MCIQHTSYEYFSLVFNDFLEWFFQRTGLIGIQPCCMTRDKITKRAIGLEHWIPGKQVRIDQRTTGWIGSGCRLSPCAGCTIMNDSEISWLHCLSRWHTYHVPFQHRITDMGIL